MSRLRSVLLLVAMVLATLAMLLWLKSPVLPLGVPGEWGWSTIAWTPAHPFAWISNLFVAAVVVGTVALLSRRLPETGAGSSHVRRCVTSSIVCVVAAGWWLHLLTSIPGPYGLARCPFVLFYPRMTGYYSAARYSKDDATTFLRGYERMLRDLKGTERYLHIGTHPPGLILLNRGFLALTSSPAVVRAVQATMPEQFRDANETIATESALTGRDFTASDGAALWLITLATIAAAAGCIPLIAGLLRAAGHSEQSALRWAALWMFTPAVAVFLPKDDVLFAFPALLAARLWVSAIQHDSRWRAVAAGATCYAGLFCSLAFLPVMLWMVIATVWAWWKETRVSAPISANTVKPRAGALAAGLAGLLVPLVLFVAVFQTNLPTIWRMNFENHAEFYQHNERTYWKWIIANVGELSFAVGPAVFVLAVACGVLKWGRQGLGAMWSAIGPAGLIVLGVLWISGKNMGEAARLWILFLPWLLLCMSPVVSRGSSADERAGGVRLWWVAAALQAIACIAAATQIDGFGFSELK